MKRSLSDRLNSALGNLSGRLPTPKAQGGDKARMPSAVDPAPQVLSDLRSWGKPTPTTWAQHNWLLQRPELEPIGEQDPEHLSFDHLFPWEVAPDRTVVEEAGHDWDALLAKYDGSNVKGQSLEDARRRKAPTLGLPHEPGFVDTTCLVAARSRNSPLREVCLQDGWILMLDGRLTIWSLGERVTTEITDWEHGDPGWFHEEWWMPNLGIVFNRERDPGDVHRFSARKIFDGNDQRTSRYETDRSSDRGERVKLGDHWVYADSSSWRSLVNLVEGRWHNTYVDGVREGERSYEHVDGAVYDEAIRATILNNLVFGLDEEDAERLLAEWQRPAPATGGSSSRTQNPETADSFSKHRSATAHSSSAVGDRSGSSANPFARFAMLELADVPSFEFKLLEGIMTLVLEQQQLADAHSMMGVVMISVNAVTSEGATKLSGGAEKPSDELARMRGAVVEAGPEIAQDALPLIDALKQPLQVSLSENDGNPIKQVQHCFCWIMTAIVLAAPKNQWTIEQIMPTWRDCSLDWFRFLGLLPRQDELGESRSDKRPSGAASPGPQVEGRTGPPSKPSEPATWGPPQASPAAPVQRSGGDAPNTSEPQQPAGRRGLGHRVRLGLSKLNSGGHFLAVSSPDPTISPEFSDQLYRMTLADLDRWLNVLNSCVVGSSVAEYHFYGWQDKPGQPSVYPFAERFPGDRVGDLVDARERTVRRLGCRYDWLRFRDRQSSNDFYLDFQPLSTIDAEPVVRLRLEGSWGAKAGDSPPSIIFIETIR